MAQALAAIDVDKDGKMDLASMGQFRCGLTLFQYLPSPATHAIWTVLKAGETVHQAGELPKTLRVSKIHYEPPQTVCKAPFASIFPPSMENGDGTRFHFTGAGWCTKETRNVIIRNVPRETCEALTRQYGGLAYTYHWWRRGSICEMSRKHHGAERNGL